jgi:cell shape-determining protein MreD
MLKNLIAFPLLFLVVILQSAVISRITLLAGYGDLMLVVLAAWSLQPQVETSWHWAILGGILVIFVTALPWPVILIGYGLVILLARLMQGRFWQTPLLVMFSVTFLGTMGMNLLSISVLQLAGTPVSFGDALGYITLPSLLLNLLLAIPVYAFMRDLAQWIYPTEKFE